MTGTVYVVFCMDTEGPCADPGNPELLGTWELVDGAMDKLFEPSFRERARDPAGGALRIGWFFLTWAGFTSNPRGRDFGLHAVRDHYLARWGEALEACGDEQLWHYHHPAPSRIGNEWGLDWSTSSEYDEIVSRQLLEREWFPVGYRAGGTIMDEVSSRWVDAWFPVDYTNRAPLALPDLVDWSGGVADWSLYHPSPEDFRRPGAGRRRMARCLDLRTGVHALSEADVVAAFERAERGLPALLSTFDHDYRDIAERVDELRRLVASVAERFPAVPWRYAAPVEAVRGYLDAPPQAGLELDAAWLDGSLHVRSSAPVFQSIPWVAVRRPDGSVEHVEDGVLRLEPTRWRWTPPDGLACEQVALGVSTDLGEAATAVVGRDDGPGALFLRRRTGASPTQPRAIWEHSKYYVELCRDRASGVAPEMDAARQAAQYLGERLQAGMSVLDVGSAAGHLQRSLRALGLDYHGIDPASRAIEIGRLYGPGAGVPASRLRTLPVEELPVDERYDAVVCLSTLMYLPEFRQPLEAMARAARRCLVLRASFGERTETRYVPDVWLEPGFEAMRTYLNIYSRTEVQAFLEAEGFSVAWEADRRQQERFGGQPEQIAGLEIPYEFLVAERVAPPPTVEQVLGEELVSVAASWRAERDGR